MTDQDNYVDPSRTHFDAFKALPRDQPVHMLNLLRFRDQADYPSTHPCSSLGLSGADAYARYSSESGPIFGRVGGQIVWRGDYESMVIGPLDERWDHAFVAYYPTAAAFLEMVTDTIYRDAVVHRQAAILTSRLIRFQPQPLGEGF